MMSLAPSSTMVTSPSASSPASGWLAILQEEDVVLKEQALQALLGLVDTAWHEMAEVLPELEALAEENGGNVAAAALASKVLFHLQEPMSALKVAVTAGVSLHNNDPYTTTMTQTALDAYLQLRRGSSSSSAGEEEAADVEGLTTDQLEPLVQQFLDAACRTENYKEAVGICLEAQWPEQLKATLASSSSSSSQEDAGILSYTWEQLLTTTSSLSKSFRTAAAHVVAEQLEAASDGVVRRPDLLVVVYQWLQAPAKVAAVLRRVDTNQALQLAFDVQETAGDPAFVHAVTEALLEDHAVDANVLKVLRGGFVTELALSFLHKQSHADRGILEQCKTKLEERGSRSSSILHNATVVTHAYLYAGTTNDSFLRDNLDWMKKASNWAKFTATSSLGVVHASHVTEAMQLLEPYLPQGDVSTAGGYAEGGSLYALGLIHGSHPAVAAEQRQTALEYIRDKLRTSHANEVMSHGAALAVGLTAMGSADPMIVQELKELLDTDSAAAGEAAGMAIGMVLAGKGNSMTEEMKEMVLEIKSYARETKHEKIIRGIAMGLALMCFGLEENADVLIEEMRSDRDPIMRYGAQYALSLAYVGTGSSKAVRILLHTAVSDVSDDVRMAAVVGLAFVLYKTPEKVPQLVQLLLESFNPHVRYASCMAVGIAMAGTGDSDSVALLEPMLEDMTDYVRQGALMGTAMIYMQQSDTANGRKIRSFREKLFTLVAEKHQSTLTKMGAILAMGIIDAGGRNCALRLGSSQGFTRMSSTVGMALWLQHWHWYPMMHMFSLALTPTLTIGVNADLKYPKQFHVVCNSKPSVFAYPKKLEEKKEKEKKRVETVTLSITAKEKARQARKKAKLGEGAMDVETTTSPDGKPSDAMDVDKDAAAAGNGDDEEVKPEPVKQRKKREPEPTSFLVHNLSRITTEQAQVCSFDLQQRYRPVRSGGLPRGVIVLTDSDPSIGVDEELGAVKPPSLEPEGELAPPEPFEWSPPPLPVVEEDAEEAPPEDGAPAADGAAAAESKSSEN